MEVDARSTPGMSVRYSSGQNLGGFRRRVVNANNVVVGQTFPVLTVIDGGNPLAPQFYTPVKLNAVDPLRLIIGGSNAVYESFTAGSTIVEIGRGIVVNDSLGLEAIAYGGWQGGVANLMSSMSALARACSCERVHRPIPPDPVSNLLRRDGA